MIENELGGPGYKQTQPSGSQKILLEGSWSGYLVGARLCQFQKWVYNTPL